MSARRSSRSRSKPRSKRDGEGSSKTVRGSWRPSKSIGRARRYIILAQPPKTTPPRCTRAAGRAPRQRELRTCPRTRARTRNFPRARARARTRNFSRARAFPSRCTFQKEPNGENGEGRRGDVPPEPHLLLQGFRVQLFPECCCVALVGNRVSNRGGRRGEAHALAHRLELVRGLSGDC